METKAVIVTDLGYGDAGKGTMVDYLVRQEPSAVVIRHNGGAQAAHNVIAPDGRHHTFSQFGSGTFVPGVRTHLSRFMLVNPLDMNVEAEYLAAMQVPDPWGRTSVDCDALLITPWHVAGNQIRERARGQRRHGSCGKGIGETMADALAQPDLALHIGDILSDALEAKLEDLREYKLSQIQQEFGDEPFKHYGDLGRVLTDTELTGRLAGYYREWAAKVAIVDGDFLKRLSAQHKLLVFEGAQGVLLDEWHGFHPYTTWSTTTHANALQLLSEIDFGGDVRRLGVLRAYATRHGNGPFVSEMPRLSAQIADHHNKSGSWQGEFRYGALDLVALRYALAVCGGTDELAMTCIDRLRAVDTWTICNAYRLYDGAASDADEFFDFAPDGRITDMRVGKQGDLDRQARLTTLLSACAPVCDTMQVSKGSHRHDPPQDYIHLVEEALGLPITLASFGPTADDKRALRAR